MLFSGGGSHLSASDDSHLDHFVSLARQVETFFLQKRLLIHNHKPEMILREDSLELKQELIKKDEIIRRHGEKLAQWKNLLQDMQQGQQAGQPGQPTAPQGPPAGAAPQQQPGPRPGTATTPKKGGLHCRLFPFLMFLGLGGPSHPHGGPGGMMPMHPGAPMAPGAGAPQGGFVPGNNYRMQARTHFQIDMNL